MKIKKSRVSKSPVLADDSNGELYNVDVMSTSEKAISSSSHTVSDDGAWEDEPEINLARPDEKSPSPPSRSVRKRKVGSRTIFVAQPNSSRKVPSAKAKNIAADVPPLFDIDREQLRDAFRSGGFYALEYAFDVVKTAIQFLRKPLSFFLFIWLLSLIFSQIHGFLRTIVSPVCWIPGVSRTPLCYTPAPPPRVPKWADYPKLVEMEGSTFEQLLDESVGGSGLSLEIKRAEMATSDLVTLVKVSSLRSKDRMAQYLEEFVADAKTTGRGLQKLSSRIGGAVDREISILAVNDHALHTIEAHQDKSKSALAAFWPFSSTVATREVIIQTFTDAMSVLQTQMQRVVLEAEVSLTNLNNLEEKLSTLHEFVLRENEFISTAKSEMLAELWTVLGGNKRKLHGMDRHLQLLRGIGDYRKRAKAHVHAALQALQGMSEDMEDLRQRVAAPELVGERIPVEVHMKSIKAGLDRLAAERTKAKEKEEAAVRRILGIDEDEN
ncbi:hypothetical protein PHLCEN_2v6338 [Hermanssonia centrifuga]|uniref:Uncharacterized protein n=1 Tax=Hermanssonia centrifuga TaxID=98765 RepID=A0A2R6NZQ9_9APHY|nr:hypothetical protein PHLCEN_2v6338 [Hermanssonia centrifuga]